MTKHEVQAQSPDMQKARTNVAYTLTHPDAPKENKKRFMLTFGMHGREYISSETALHLSHYVCNTMAKASSKGSAALGSAPDAPQSAPSTQGPKAEHMSAFVEVALGKKMELDRLTKILQATEITYIPVLNIDGRKKVESGDSCTNQRKNGRNVDINRNFADWFAPNNAGPHDEDYQGTNPMSEWESNIVKTLASQFKPHAYLDIHSGDLGMGTVYGHSGTDKSPHDSVNQKWVQGIDNEVFGDKVWHGNLANMGTMPYESHGSSCDYMYHSQGARLSGTWEIWRKQSFFAASSSSSASSSVAMAGSMRLKEDAMTDAASKFDHVDTNVVSIAAVSDSALPRDLLPNQKLNQVGSALIPGAMAPTASKPTDELQGLLQSALDTSGEHNDALGLTRDEMQSLIQSMQNDGMSTPDIQVRFMPIC
jgi:hypothetical protein